MPNDNSDQGQARARLAQLEKDPKHTGPNAEASEHTRGGRLDDPAHQASPDLEGGWKEADDGTWQHPDFADED